MASRDRYHQAVQHRAKTFKIAECLIVVSFTTAFWVGALALGSYAFGFIIDAFHVLAFGLVIAAITFAGLAICRPDR